MTNETLNRFNELTATDDANALARDLLICDDASTLHDTDYDITIDDAHELRSIILNLDTHARSMMRLDYSICPLHAIDYAICFDDDDDECASIRACFPSHDT